MATPMAGQGIPIEFLLRALGLAGGQQPGQGQQGIPMGEMQSALQRPGVMETGQSAMLPTSEELLRKEGFAPLNLRDDAHFQMLLQDLMRRQPTGPVY